MNRTLINILPIVIASVLYLYHKETALFAHSVLGKLVAVFLVILYTISDPLYGAVVCALVIFYYQTDFVEGFSLSVTDNLDKLDYCTNSEGFHYSSFDHDDTIPIVGYLRNDVQNVFINTNCDNKRLKYKSMEVKSEMAPHVFSELNYTDGPCNPCSDSCGFSIIEERLRTK